MDTRPRILYCRCAHADLAPLEANAAVLRGMAPARGRAVTVLDLCGLAARRDPMLAGFAAGGPVVIAACEERAVRWLFAAAGAPLPAEGVESINLRSAPVADIAARIAAAAGPAEAAAPQCACACSCGGAGEAAGEGEAQEWVPWFPVIDYERCTDCGQCLGFCLFDVFARDADNKVRVVNPANCKTNCPACARVCPAQAIMFPKHKDPALSGGAGRAAEPVDVKSLVGDDVRAALRKRGGGRRFALAQAGEERRTCACSSGAECASGILGALGVPAEVIDALSPEEIAAAAAKKAAAERRGACDCDCGCGGA